MEITPGQSASNIDVKFCVCGDSTRRHLLKNGRILTRCQNFQGAGNSDACWGYLEMVVSKAKVVSEL